MVNPSRMILREYLTVLRQELLSLLFTVKQISFSNKLAYYIETVVLYPRKELLVDINLYLR